eukprot:COSAG05_NODE_14070_length_409_cov_0.667742_1_plen_24_part_01
MRAVKNCMLARAARQEILALVSTV